jgi:hypothetical protein
VAAETEALSEEVDHLLHAVDRALASASTSPAEGWVEAVLQLEMAKGLIHGNGPGGDL